MFTWRMRDARVNSPRSICTAVGGVYPYALYSYLLSIIVIIKKGNGQWVYAMRHPVFSIQYSVFGSVNDNGKAMQTFADVFVFRFGPPVRFSIEIHFYLASKSFDIASKWSTPTTWLMIYSK